MSGFYDYICDYDALHDAGCGTGCFYENGQHTKEECAAFRANKKQWGIPLKIRTDQDDLRESIKTGQGRMYESEREQAGGKPCK